MATEKELYIQLEKSLAQLEKNHRDYLFYKKHRLMRFVKPIKYEWLMIHGDIWIKLIRTYRKVIKHLKNGNRQQIPQERSK